MEYVKLGIKVFQGQSRNEVSYVSYILVDDTSIAGAHCTWKERLLKIWYPLHTPPPPPPTPLQPIPNPIPSNISYIL